MRGVRDRWFRLSAITTGQRYTRNYTVPVLRSFSPMSDKSRPLLAFPISVTPLLYRRFSHAYESNPKLYLMETSTCRLLSAIRYSIKLRVRSFWPPTKPSILYTAKIWETAISLYQRRMFTGYSQHFYFMKWYSKNGGHRCSLSHLSTFFLYLWNSWDSCRKFCCLLQICNFLQLTMVGIFMENYDDCKFLRKIFIFLWLKLMK